MSFGWAAWTTAIKLWRGRAEKSGNLGNPCAEKTLQRRSQPIHTHWSKNQKPRPFLQSKHTMEHIYHIDDDVFHQFQGPQGRDVVEASHIYTIVALLPVEADGRPRYRIKSKDENFERVVAEDLLSRSN